MPALKRAGWLGLAVSGLLLSACAVTQPIFKIGLVAPFEGRYRSVGYEVIYAARLAVQEANRRGGVAGYGVELVALDDSGDVEQARAQARKLATDPQVVGVVGDWLEATSLAAAPEYARAGLPFLATAAGDPLPPVTFRLWRRAPCHLELAAGCVDALEDLRLRGTDGVTLTAPAPLPAEAADATFADRYRAISNGVAPGFNAVLAYDAARLLLDAAARDLQTNKTPTLAGVGVALAQSDRVGLSGRLRFDSQRNWADARAWTYVWRSGALSRP